MIAASVRLLLAAMVASLAVPEVAAAPVGVEPALTCPAQAASIELRLDGAVRAELASATAQAVWALPGASRPPTRPAPAAVAAAWAPLHVAPDPSPALDAAPKTSPPTTTTAC
ncbi:MAG: hypothetical protein R3B06_00360 [Kofleriaceae bacterium]